MAINPRLKAVVTTELTTIRFAQWLLKEIGMVCEAILDGKPTTTTAEHEALSSIAEVLTETIKQYKEHRKESDKLRSQVFEKLINVCVGETMAFADIICGRNNHIRNGVNCTLTEFEGLVESHIKAKNWQERCHRCKRLYNTYIAVEDKFLCQGCAPMYSGKCQTCGERKLSENLTQVVDMKAAWYCKEHLPGGIEICTGCKRAFRGPGRDGNRVTAAEMLAEGITACRECAPAYARRKCGHISDGHRKLPIHQHKEDDQRDREPLVGMVKEDVVCDKCYVEAANDILVDFWNASRRAVESKDYSEIGSTRSFGIELEFCQAKKQIAMPDDMKQYWTAKRDESLPNGGVEMASSILYGNDGLKVVRDFCNYCKKNDWAVDARCGMHLHCGLLNETTAQTEAVAMGYLITHEVWCQFVPASRWKTCKYCRKNNTTPEQALTYKGRIVPTLIQVDQSGPHGRRMWCNWLALNKLGTVEIRLHHGTRMYDKIANWTKAHLLFVDWCVSLGGPQEVYDALIPYREQDFHPRKLFLFMAAKVWRDNNLSRWFKERSKTLHGASSLLTKKSKAKLPAKKAAAGEEAATATQVVTDVTTGAILARVRATTTNRIYRAAPATHF